MKNDIEQEIKNIRHSIGLLRELVMQERTDIQVQVEVMDGIINRIKRLEDHAEEVELILNL